LNSLFQTLALNQTTSLMLFEARNLIKRNLAVGTFLFLFALVSSLVTFTLVYTAPESINPVAALAAVTVAIVGIAWFKKTTN
jgi:hypothetical protein